LKESNESLKSNLDVQHMCLRIVMGGYDCVYLRYSKLTWQSLN